MPHPGRDRALLWTLRLFAVSSVAIVLLVVAFVSGESAPALAEVGPVRFFSDPSWHPASGFFNMVPMLAGTVLVSAGALLLAAPLGVLSAIFLQFYAPPALRSYWRNLIGLLAGIPSVVYGFWGLVSLVPLINRLHPPGQSLLAGILVLALMVLPTIALLSDAALESVPAHYLRSAAALGLSRWGTVSGVVLPAARGGILTGVALAAARAVGETMAVLMVCGNVVRMPEGLFDPVRTLTANIALEMAYAGSAHRSALFVSGLALLAIVALGAGFSEAARRKVVANG
ncbi:MAG: phosphate ABC transporter permease subunit PstC [Myxococcales bacterium]|nr:phosphate ABC transporter permease subunit PstC [Myxococcales bacterium]